MTLAPGKTEGGPENRHRGADQWLFVVSGTGEAVVNEEKVPLKAGTLLLVERGEAHEVRNTGDGPLRTLNVYVPPASPGGGEGLRRWRTWRRGGTRTEGAACPAVWHGDVVGDRPDRTVPRQLCWPGPGLPGSRGLLSPPERCRWVSSASDNRQPRLRSPCLEARRGD